MAAQGEFIVVRREDDAGRSFFVPSGSDLQVEAGSVSSEWTTESEAEDSARAGGFDSRTAAGLNGQAARLAKRRIRNWRMRYLPPGKGAADGVADTRSGSESSSSSTGSVRRGSRGSSSSSSSTSSGSSSTSGGEVARQKRQRRQILREWEEQPKGVREVAGTLGYPPPQPPAPVAANPPVTSPLAPPPSAPVPPADKPPWCRTRSATQSTADKESCRASRQLQWHSAEKRYRCFAVSPGFLSAEDIRALHSAAKHPSVREINDRKGYLAFKHRVWRFEMQLRALYPELYQRLLALMREADISQWKRLRAKKKKLYPEIEYIEYDVAEMGEPCFIEPHVDNKSAVTLVAMLSAPWEHDGGRSCFRRSSGRKGHREVGLQQGDAVLFRGEKLVHWITPVTSGRRVILQIELSRV